MTPGLVLVAALLGAARPAPADEVRVAVAANFLKAAERLARSFEAATGHRVVLSGGSTGALHAQIRNAAPFDVFLAADARHPALLEEEGLGSGRFTYAVGRLALAGRALRHPHDGRRDLETGAFTKLALARPETAPYGAAARQVLERLGLWERLSERLVFGTSVGQAWQFVRTGGAELGFVALSQVVPEGRDHWPVPGELHDPIRQDAIVLDDRPAVQAFAAFLASDAAQSLIVAAGYGRGGAAAPALPHARAPATEQASAWSPIWLTLKLAAAATAVLLVACTPLAWWLARGRSPLRTVVEAAATLPLVLPPTVLGFYLLVLLAPGGPVGGPWESLGGPRLVFSFPGLLVGSVLYSLPFVVQPLKNGFAAVDGRVLDAAATLRAGPLDRFLRVVVPLSRPAFLTAATLGFAHTVGEFGVVLMIGGSVPDQTRVLSIAVFEHVERLEYGRAHLLAGGLLAFSFLVLLLVHGLGRRPTGSTP